MARPPGSGYESLMRVLTPWVAPVLVLAALISAPRAAGAELIDNFGDWSAFKENEDGKPVCWIASQPKKAEGKYTRRGDTYVLVTHRPSEKSLGVVSIGAGYTYKKDSLVELTIGKDAYRMFTDGGFAWNEDHNSDMELVQGMSRGYAMIVKGTSDRGTPTTDTYSLKGFTAAYKAITKACEVK